MSEDITKILDSVDTRWPKNYIIRYLYIKLAPYFERDLNFFLASHQEQLDQYRKGFYDRGNKIVCSTLVDYYIGFLKKFGIRARKVIASKSDIPLFAMLVEGDNGWFYIDPLNDLFINQYELQSRYFGIIPTFKELQKEKLTTFTLEELRGMDHDLKLHKFDIYTSDIFDNIRNEFRTRSIACKKLSIPLEELSELTRRKMQIVNDCLINLGNVPGLFERFYMYGFIRGQLFDKTERKYTSCQIDTEDPTDLKLNFIIDYPTSDEEVYEEVCDEKGMFTLERIK